MIATMLLALAAHAEDPNHLLARAIAEAGSMELLEQALSAGADPNAPGPYDGHESAVALASSSVEWEMLRRLIAAGGDVRTRNAEGVPLLAAVPPGEALFVDLLARGANPTDLVGHRTIEGDPATGALVLALDDDRLLLLLAQGTTWKQSWVEGCLADAVSATPVVENELVWVGCENGMGDRAGTALYKRDGTPVDLGPLQTERRKRNPYADRCVRHAAAEGGLVFWDLNYRGAPWNCYVDSQNDDTDPSAWNVPRLYHFDVGTRLVRLVELEAPCARPVVDGKLVRH